MKITWDVVERAIAKTKRKRVCYSGSELVSRGKIVIVESVEQVIVFVNDGDILAHPEVFEGLPELRKGGSDES